MPQRRSHSSAHSNAHVLAHAVAGILAIAASGAGAAAGDSIPVDRFGRALYDARGGSIAYQWDGVAWSARHDDGTLTPTSGPSDPTATRSPATRSPAAGYSLLPYNELHPGGRAEAVAIGDVTNDGRPDVLLTTTSSSDPSKAYQVFLFAQKTDTTLASPVAYPYGSTASRNGIVLADLDEDLLLDVIVGHGNGISVLLADGLGGLAAPVVHPDDQANTLAAMDVDRDGHLDIISLSWSSDATIFYGDGTGGFSRLQSLVTNEHGYNDHEVEDLDDDGVLDLAVMSGQGASVDQLTVHLHDGIGALSAGDRYEVVPARIIDGIGLGDVTGDGLHDAVVSRSGNSPTSILIMASDGLGAMTGPITLPSYDIPEALEAADMDGDGLEDVVVVHGGWLEVGVYLQAPATGLGSETLYSIPYASHYPPQGLAVGDFNSDGCADVAIADYNQGLVWLYGANCVSACSSTPPRANAGADRQSCGVSPVTLDASGSTGCAGGYSHRWLDATRVVCDWSLLPTCEVDPFASTTYTLEIECAAEPACRASDTVVVEVFDAPDVYPGPPLVVCEGATITLGSASALACTPPNAPIYEWRDGSVICPWSALPRCVVTPTSTTTYTLAARCVPSPDCEGSGNVSVTVEPNVAPPGLGNSLRSVHVGLDVSMMWGTEPLATTYTLYRSTVKETWPPPLREGLPGPSAVEPDLPPTPEPLYFYRVAGASCGGIEGP